jgi:hypothetical protein
VRILRDYSQYATCLEISFPGTSVSLTELTGLRSCTLRIEAYSVLPEIS